MTPMPRAQCGIQWESYCRAEFGISRAQAYRLLDIARRPGRDPLRGHRRHRDVSHARQRPGRRGRARLRLSQRA